MRANVDPLTSVIGSAGQVTELQAAVKTRPDDPGLVARLGLAYLQRARETADPSYYTRADELLRRARTLEPSSLDAVVGLGSLALSRHQFRRRCSSGRRRSASPAVLAGREGDRRRRADRARQVPAGVRDHRRAGRAAAVLVAYARQSYALELQGDLAGATD